MQLEGIEQGVFIRVYGYWCCSDESMGWGVKKRQIKKLNQTAMRLLGKIKPRLEFAKVDSYDACEKVPVGTWVVWHKTSYEYDEWEFETAYCWLQDILYWEFMDAEWGEEETIFKFTPDLSTPKKVFDLAKQLIGRGAA